MRVFLRKLSWIAERRRKEEELREELAFHLAEESDQGTASGLSDRDARFAARRELGNVALIAEDTRSTWGWIWIERVGQDVRYAARMMRRKPGFALAAIVTLMLGIGGNTAIFSLMNALLMRSLLVDRPDDWAIDRESARSGNVTRPDDFTRLTHDTLQRQTRGCRGSLASSISRAPA